MFRSKNKAHTNQFQPIWDCIFRYFKEQEEYQVLKEIPLFETLTNRELKKVSALLHLREYEPDEYIFQMYQPGAAMYIVDSGKVDIIQESEDDSYKLAHLETGEFFGDLALLDNSPRSASAVAQEKTRLLAIFRSELDKFLHDEPKMGVKIVKQLAIIIGMRLKVTNKQLSLSEQQTPSELEQDN